jgi:hypothetical protein
MSSFNSQASEATDIAISFQVGSLAQLNAIQTLASVQLGRLAGTSGAGSRSNCIVAVESYTLLKDSAEGWRDRRLRLMRANEVDMREFVAQVESMRRDACSSDDDEQRQ